MKVKLFVAYEVTSHDAGSSFRTFENAKEALEHIEINSYLTENYQEVDEVLKALLLKTDKLLFEIDSPIKHLYLTGDGEYIGYIVNQVIMIETSEPGTWKEITKEELERLYLTEDVTVLPPILEEVLVEPAKEKNEVSSKLAEKEVKEDWYERTSRLIVENSPYNSKNEIKI